MSRGIIAVVLSGTLLSGCLVKTAANVATFPVRAGGKVVDWSTTSQSEADRNRGRKMRKQEERDRKEAAKEAKRQRRLERDQPY